MDEETLNLGKWVKCQRRMHTTSKLLPQRAAALERIGFSFAPGALTKDEKLEVQLGLLDTLRKRREISNSQVNDLNVLYDKWSAAEQHNS